ncbi:MAG TPA: hypothetical protein VFG73_05940 [Rhodanobacteraceae bacterium]|nr:hypothetical protein [Rhodanobacteraceae bacterium]
MVELRRLFATDRSCRPHPRRRHQLFFAIRPAAPGARRVLLAATLALCSGGPLRAQAGEVTGGAALSSQLIDRGIAITPATPVLQGTLAWNTTAGWSLSLSGGAELRSPGRLAEAIAQASRYWTLDPAWQMRASLLYYRYSGSAASSAYDRWEASLGWTYRDVLTLGLSALRPIGAIDSDVRGALDIGFRWPLAHHLYVSAGFGIAQRPATGYVSSAHVYKADTAGGYHRAGDHSPYRYGQAGLLWSNGPWRVEIARIATDLDPGGRRGVLAASPWVATISRSF